MEGFLGDFELDKDRSTEALRRWRSAVSLVKNPRRRFRNVADLGKHAQLIEEKERIQEKIRLAVLVQKEALKFVNAGSDRVEVEIDTSDFHDGFDIDPDSIASLVHNYDDNGFKKVDGVEGIARKLRVSVVDGVRGDSLNTRQHYFGFNCYAEKHPKTFIKFVWESMLDSTLIFLMVCSIVLIGGKFATEGWLVNVYDEVGIILGAFFLVIFTAVNDYQQSLKFSEWDRENKNISVKVTRDGKRQKISIYDLVVGDIVHLSIGVWGSNTC